MSREPGFLGEFLTFVRDYWLWWVVPIGLVLLLIVLVALLGSGSEGGFDYAIF